MSSANHSPEPEAQGSLDKKGSAGIIPPFTPGRGGPQITSATAMNRLVNRINALSRLQITRGSSADELLLSDSNAILNLKDVATEDAVLGGGGSQASAFTLVSVQDDYVRATLAGTSTDYSVAKEYKLRNSLLGETIFTVPHTYSYAAGPDSNNIQRTNSDGTISEVEIVIPPWVVGETLYAVQVATGLVDLSSNPITWEMIGRSAQWAKYGEMAIATGTPSSASDTTNGYGAGLIACDGSFIYISTGVNAWARVAIASW
jgi:hypothetical protein